jgi:hypothetical protein
MLTSLSATGCTKAVSLSIDELETQKSGGFSAFEIKTHGAEEYRVRHFVVDDSTLIITELVRTPPGVDRQNMPIRLRLDEIESITREDARPGISFIVLTVVGVFVIFAISGFSISGA